MSDDRDVLGSRLRALVLRAAVWGGLAFMFVVTALTLYFAWSGGALEEMVKHHYRVVVGMPLMAMTSLLLVCIFHAAAGPIEFETPFGFKFRGASGPIVLFVMCYLAFAATLRLLW